jgi:uncharacterized protein involved in exopolysaccharide biosynthesis
MEIKDKETISLKSIIVRYLHHWKLFLAVFLCSFIPAILYLVIIPRTYEFAASIQLQEEKESSMASFGLGEAAGLMKSFGIGSGGGGIQIDDEISILTSNRMFRKMIIELGLNVAYSKPYSLYKMYHDTPLRLTADSVTMANLEDEYIFNVSVSPNNIKVKAKNSRKGFNQTFNYPSLPARIKAGSADFTLDFNENNISGASYNINIRCFPASWLAEDLVDNIKIEEVSTSSNVLEFTCSDHSADRGKDMLNTLIRKYNEDVENFKSIEDNKTMAFVDGRITKVVADLRNVEHDIEVYKTRNNMTILESDVTMYSEAMKELQTMILDIESQAYVIDMLDEYVKNPENRYNVIPSLMTVSKGEQVGAISKYNEALVERDRLLKNSNETNPMFKIVDNQVEVLRQGVFVMIENTRKGTIKTLEGLKKKENELLQKMKTIPEKEREYVGYRRDQEILQGIYLMLLQKREETMLSLGKNTDRARVIEPAYMKKKSLGPKKLYAAIGILVLTLVIPTGCLFAKDLFLSIKEEYNRAK